MLGRGKSDLGCLSSDLDGGTGIVVCRSVEWGEVVDVAGIDGISNELDVGRGSRGRIIVELNKFRTNCLRRNSMFSKVELLWIVVSGK